MEEKSQIKEIEKYIGRLESKTNSMKFLGMIMLIVTTLNLLTAMFMSRMLFSSSDYGFGRPVNWAFASLLGVTVLVAALRFDQLRREGETLFEVISDELHAKTDSNYSDSEREQGKQISIWAKYVLREFSRNSDVPLIPGKFGPGILCLVNLLLAFLLTGPFHFARYS